MSEIKEINADRIVAIKMEPTGDSYDNVKLIVRTADDEFIIHLNSYPMNMMVAGYLEQIADSRVDFDDLVHVMKATGTDILPFVSGNISSRIAKIGGKYEDGELREDIGIDFYPDSDMLNLVFKPDMYYDPDTIISVALNPHMALDLAHKLQVAAETAISKTDEKEKNSINKMIDEYKGDSNE